MLSETQKDTVRGWAEAGAGLGEIHKRINEELKITMTYFDARLLVSDLQLSLDKPDPVEEMVEDADAPAEEVISDPELLGEGEVSITVDTIAQPQALVSGKVTFADGKRASWSLDQMGRLGINPDDAGYRPSQEDVTAFQKQLQTTLQSQGF